MKEMRSIPPLSPLQPKPDDAADAEMDMERRGTLVVTRDIRGPVWNIILPHSGISGINQQYPSPISTIHNRDPLLSIPNKVTLWMPTGERCLYVQPSRWSNNKEDNEIM